MKPSKRESEGKGNTLFCKAKSTKKILDDMDKRICKHSYYNLTFIAKLLSSKGNKYSSIYYTKQSKQNTVQKVI